MENQRPGQSISRRRNGLPRSGKIFPSLVLLALLLGACDTGSKNEVLNDTAEPAPIPMDGPWADYKLDPPTEAQNLLLVQTPYLYPEKSCRLASELENLPESATLTTLEDGESYVCVWNSPTAFAPEGIVFNEIGSCDHVFTQAPSWFMHPQRLYDSDASLLEDEAFTEELRWAQAQVASSGCSCCHSSQSGSNHGTAWDADAPAVWTDTISLPRLYLLSGMIPEHREFGAFAPEENHGASREIVMVPSSDPERLRAFFVSEFERRGGTEEDKEDAQKQMDTLFSRKAAEPRACIDPFEGLIDGKLVWNNTQGVRQVYLQEMGSEIPGFPPNLDKPAGTVWAFRVPADMEPIKSGTVVPGELPEGAVQLIPEDGSAPVLESGERYRFFATPDVMLLNLANCTIDMP